MAGPMKGATVLAFAAGVLCGALAVGFLLPPAPPPEKAPSPVVPAASAGPSRRPREAVPRIDAPSDRNAGELEEKVGRLEKDLAAARKEARANLLKGVLLLEVDGHAPEEILKPLQDVEPERGMLRIDHLPEAALANPWMYLYSVAPEDFEAALGKGLDASLRWVAEFDLRPEEVRAVRDFTERAYRLMVEVQQRRAALRRMLADEGRYTPEERRTLEEKFRHYEGFDFKIYTQSFRPGLTVPLLFPRADGK